MTLDIDDISSKLFEILYRGIFQDFCFNLICYVLVIMFSSLGDTPLTCSQNTLQLIQDTATQRGTPIDDENLLVIGIFLECIFQELDQRGILNKYIISTQPGGQITLDEMTQLNDPKMAL